MPGRYCPLLVPTTADKVATRKRRVLVDGVGRGRGEPDVGTDVAVLL
jgi:hypothetical protein